MYMYIKLMSQRYFPQCFTVSFLYLIGVLRMYMKSLTIGLQLSLFQCLLIVRGRYILRFYYIRMLCCLQSLQIADSRSCMHVNEMW